MNILLLPLALIMLPFYFVTYTLCKAFNVQGHENMPTIFEFLGRETEEE